MGDSTNPRTQAIAALAELFFESACRSADLAQLESSAIDIGHGCMAEALGLALEALDARLLAQKPEGDLRPRRSLAHACHRNRGCGLFFEKVQGSLRRGRLSSGRCPGHPLWVPDIARRPRVLGSEASSRCDGRPRKPQVSSPRALRREARARRRLTCGARSIPAWRLSAPSTAPAPSTDSRTPR